MRLHISCVALFVLAGCGSKTGLDALEGDDETDWTLPLGCSETDAELSIFLLSGDNVIYGFGPRDLSTYEVGRLTCPSDVSPNTMAIARGGIGYVGYSDGGLFELQMSDAACTPTAFDTTQLVYDRYGLGFVAEETGVETLYAAENDFSHFSPGLVEIDTQTFERRFVTAFDPPLMRVELTGTGDGRLYGYAMDEVGSRLVTIDRKSGAVHTERDFSFGGPNTSFDFAFWGGDFYFFVSDSTSNSSVWHYQPETGDVRLAGQVDAEIVGAGVTTCAPLSAGNRSDDLP